MDHGWTPDRSDLDETAGGGRVLPPPVGPDPVVGGPADGAREAAGTLARTARFRAWDGSQAVPDPTADEVMQALREDLVEDGDLDAALRRLAQRGLQGDGLRPDLPGLRELLGRLRRRREELLRKGKLGNLLGDVAKELEGIVADERAGIARRLAEAGESDADPSLRGLLQRRADQNLATLDALPPGPGEQLRSLADFDFLDPGARARFEALQDRLRQQILDRYAAGLANAVKGARPEDLAQAREMTRDLNRLLEERLAGGNPDASEFLARYGQSFPGAQSLDDVIEQIAGRMAAMGSLLRSLSPDQRAELEAATEALLRDDRLRWDLARMASLIDQVLPEGLGERYRFRGDDDLGLDGALGALDELTRVDRLTDALGSARSPDDLGAIDRATLADLVGPDAARTVDVLEGLGRRLEEAGYAVRTGDRLDLTPLGSRRIGQGVLDELFARLRRDTFGGHVTERAGRGGDRADDIKAYEFGDPFHLDLRSTIGNALLREENAPARRAGAPVRLVPGDFMVARTEETATAATVLLVDTSRSMLLRGCFVAAKKVAIALHALIAAAYPRDRLAVVGFSNVAREIDPRSLVGLQLTGREYGTNLQHALQLARQILARSGTRNREIVVITDGEPTAHIDEDGRVEFSYPPTRRTIEATLHEVDRCTRDGIVINTFMLDRSRGLAELVRMLTARNGGRAFYADPDRLGEYVLVDFVRKRSKRLN